MVVNWLWLLIILTVNATRLRLAIPEVAASQVCHTNFWVWAAVRTYSPLWTISAGSFAPPAQ
ncbi:hypothetical protein SRS16CHR_04314 [Variovorax sp. SRS16]|nr:hypothetical protein SRS16CHR_04314 [Variovorax sp. SRS16]